MLSIENLVTNMTLPTCNNLLELSDTDCLEMLGITGPTSVNVGDTLTLTCRYDLGRDAIYRLVLQLNGIV